MHVVSAFQHSVYLELAIIDIEQTGISKEKILAMPLDKNGPNNSSVRTVHRDGASMVDLIFIFSSICMLLGTIYGFIWRLGPVIWGLIGLVTGAIVGLAIEFLLGQRKKMLRYKDPQTEVILIVECDDRESEEVERIVWKYKAFGVAKRH